MKRPPKNTRPPESSAESEAEVLDQAAKPVKKKPRFYEPWIAYYDAELDVGQSFAHKDVIAYLLPFFKLIGEDQGLDWLSDNPIWYKMVPPGERHIRYGDLVFARKTGKTRTNAKNLLLVLEVVTSNHAAKRKKDTILQRKLNEQHKVPEFGLIWPEMKDKRTFNLYRLDPQSATYQEVGPDDQGHIHSQSIPGLSFVVQPREAWVSGMKVVIYYEGMLLLPLYMRIQLAKEAQQRACDEARERQLAEEEIREAARGRQLAEERARDEARRRQLAEEEIRASIQYRLLLEEKTAAFQAETERYRELLRLHGIDIPD